jgi:hypothetical protein
LTKSNSCPDNIPKFFAPVMDELADRYEKGLLLDHDKKINAIIKTNAPDLFLSNLKQTFQEQVKQEPVSISTFYWHNYFEDLPLDLRQEYFDKTHPLFLKALESLKESPHFNVVLSNQTSAALQLDCPEAVFLAKSYLERLVQPDGEEDINYYEVCLYFRHVLNLERFMTGYQFDLYNTLIQSKNLSEDSSIILEHLNNINEPLLTSIIRTLIQDKALMFLLESHHLHHAILAVFASIIWQFHRKDEIDPTLFSDDNVMEFLTIDSENIPCMAQVKTYLSGMAPKTLASLLRTTLENRLENLDQAANGEFAIANLMELMAHFKDASFVPGLVNVFLHDFGKVDEWIIKKTISALSSFNDAAIDCLDSKMEEVPKSKVLNVLDILYESSAL